MIFRNIFAGVDSFYEYLIKAYILFGSDEYWDMFHSAYLAVQKYFRHGPWYTLSSCHIHSKNPFHASYLSPQYACTGQ